MVIILIFEIHIDIVKTIRDPEEPGTLEELEMMKEEFITVKSRYSARLYSI
jgi:hypothetical protein